MGEVIMSYEPVMNELALIGELVLEVILISFGAGIFAGGVALLVNLAIVSVLNIVRKFY